MSDPLCEKTCTPCQAGGEPLTGTPLDQYVRQVPQWELIEGKKIRRSFKCKNFAEALAFVNQVGEIAEAEQHHPDISFGWGRATVELTTHKIDGLSPNDFIVAAKIDRLD